MPTLSRSDRAIARLWMSRNEMHLYISAVDMHLRVERGGDDAQDLRPVCPDEGHVDAAGDHRFQRGIGGRLAEAIEPAVLEVREFAARTESQAGCTAQRHGRNHHRHRCGAVASDLTRRIEQRVRHVQCLARRRRDQLRVERRAIGEVRIDLDNAGNGCGRRGGGNGGDQSGIQPSGRKTVARAGASSRQWPGHRRGPARCR